MALAMCGCQSYVEVGIDQGMDGGGSTSADVSSSSSSSEESGTSDDPPAETSTDETSTETSSATETGETSTETGETGETSSDTDPPPAEEGWLLTINGLDEQRGLYQVDTATGESTLLCTLEDLDSGLPYVGIVQSLSFTRDNRLFLTDGPSLSEVSLPDCVVSSVTDVEPGLTSIVPDDEDGLYGLTLGAGELVAIDVDSGVVTTLGNLVGVDTGLSDATWADSRSAIMMLEGGVALYEVDPDTAAATFIGPVALPFVASFGLAYHPAQDLMFVCGTQPELWTLGFAGEGMPVVPLDLLSPCDNLAAPLSADLELP